MSREGKPGRPSLVVPFLALATTVSAAVVVAIIGFLGYFSLPLLHAGALSALMSWNWEPATGHFGILAMLCGTLFTALPALALAFPLAIGVVALANGKASASAGSAVKTAVARDPNAIGYVSIGHVDASVKAVVLDGIAPTQIAARDGSYPITRNLYFNTKGEPSPLASAFFDYLYGPEGAKIIAKAGYIAIARKGQ